MSKHPLNSIIRFLLELIGIFSFGLWGYHQTEAIVRILLAIVLPLIFAVIWGVFAVQNDPSRSGKTVVQTPGPVRLVLELALFGAATWMLFDLGHTLPAIIFGVVVILHYAFSWDRITWLLKQK
jgi:hypothetical protein